VSYLETAITIDPGRPNAYKNLGLSQQALANFAEAARWFVKATQVEASDSRSFRHLEELAENHPDLLEEVPELRQQIDDCRAAVNLAQGLQPDFDAHWAKLRTAQQQGQEPGGDRRSV
jgi:tetratricopeptide (TPR) repeat protein